MKNIVMLIFTIAISAVCFSQSLSRNELVRLGYRVESFILKQDSIYDAKRTSQFIYVMVSIDSNGTINKLDLSGVKADTIYQILSRLIPADLTDWKCLKCKGKTIVIPLFYFAGSDTNDNVRQMFISHYAKIPHKEMITEAGNTIFIRWLFFIAPSRQHEEKFPEIRRIDTLKNNH